VLVFWMLTTLCDQRRTARQVNIARAKMMASMLRGGRAMVSMVVFGVSYSRPER